MNKLSTALLLLLPVFLTACSNIENSNAEIKIEKKRTVNINFYQHWVHSYEEQNGEKTINIFRPLGSREFPVSRFRMEFSFDLSGQCTYKFLSPTDQHEIRKCVYTKIGKKIYIYNDAGKLLPHLSFTLRESAKKDIMRMSYGITNNKPAKKAKK